MDWQPMDTAPKAPEDGPECWTILGYYAGNIVAPVYWAKGGWYSPITDEKWSAPLLWHPIEMPPDELIEATIDAFVASRKVANAPDSPHA